MEGSSLDVAIQCRVAFGNCDNLCCQCHLNAAFILATWILCDQQYLLDCCVDDVASVLSVGN